MTQNSRPQLVSALGRPIDPSYLPNLLILIISPVVAVIGVGIALAQGAEVTAALTQGFWSLLGAFFTWALAREIDPDHDYSAFVAVALVSLGLWFLSIDGFGLIALLLMLQLTRMVSRVVGPPLQLTDSFVVFALVIVISIFDNWMLSLVATIAFLVDAILEERLLRHVVFAVLSAAAFGIRFAISGLPEFIGTTFPVLVGAILISIIYFVTIIMTSNLTSSTDIEGYDLSITRVRAAMILPLIGAILLLIVYGDTGFYSMLPSWSAMLGVSLFRLPATLWRIRTARREAKT